MIGETLKGTVAQSSLCLMALATLCPRPGVGQASVNVSVTETVYRDIHKLVAFNLVDAIIVGQRPYSRSEIARIAAEAERNLPRLSRRLQDPTISQVTRADVRARMQAIARILDRLRRDYHEELARLGVLADDAQSRAVDVVDRIELSFFSVNSPARSIPDAGVAGYGIDAIVNPLVQNRQGREIVNGNTISLESEHRLRASQYLVFFGRPRLQLGLARNGQPDVNHVVMQDLNVKLVFKNFAVEFGRDHLLWGQGRHVGSLISANPRGFDMVKIGNESPFVLPWIFRLAGPTKFTVFLADLGPNQNFPGATLLGYKLSIKPFRILELGGGLLDQSGGEGAPEGSLLERIIDALPILEDFAGNFSISSRLATIDFRLRVPAARGMELFGELAIDDWDLGRLRAMLVVEAGHIFGVHIPRLMDTGEVDLTLEYHHTGIRTYRHNQFRSGLTLDQFVIGDPLGPDGKGLYVNLNWDVDEDNLLSFDGAFERRSRDQYSFQHPMWITIQSFPKEKRFRTVGSWSRRVPGERPLSIQTQLGYERVTNFGFVAGGNRNNFLAQVTLQLDF